MPRTIDLSQLHLRTYTGDIRPYIRLGARDTTPAVRVLRGCIEWDRFPHGCGEPGEIRLVAVTKIEAGQEPTSSYCPGISEPLRLLHGRATDVARTWWAELREVIGKTSGLGDAAAVRLSSPEDSTS